MKLTDTAIKKAQPREKQYRLPDGNGLFMVIRPAGGKLWQLRYRFEDKEKTFSLGQYPVITLLDARQRALDARRLIANGTDPSAQKQEQKQQRKDDFHQQEKDETETVEAIAREWFERFSDQWSESHAVRIIRRLERDLFPWIGKSPIASIKPADLLKVLRRVELRGAIETAHRLAQNCSQVWRYAVATDRAESDITVSLRGALPPAKERHLGAITDPLAIATLLANIDEYKGSPVVRLALKLAPLVFVRPGELRQAEWAEINLDSSTWTIPAGRMKSRRPHVVPLSVQSIAILNDLKSLTGDSKYLFPSPRSKTRCISDMALLAGLRRIGYTKEEMTAHGFRAMASTNLEHLGYDIRTIEIQLAHADKDAVRAAYKRETHLLRLPERREMMQKWADWLDSLANQPPDTQILQTRRALLISHSIA